MSPRRRLEIGDTIPDFWTRDINGTEIDSRDLKGYTLLVFLRYAGCPFCNLAIHRLSHEHKLLKKNGCRVIAFIQSTEDSIEKNVIVRHDATPPFSIVSDQQQDFYRQFGVRPNAKLAAKYTMQNASHWIDAVFTKKFTQGKVDGSAFMVPAYFLVDDKGVLQLVNYDATFYEDAVFTPIYEHLTFGPAV